MKDNYEMVIEYIKCLNSFYPTDEQIEFIKKHRNEIRENDDYRALVRESIEINDALDEYYKRVEQLPEFEVEPSLIKKVGTFVTDKIKDNIKDIKNSIDCSLQLTQLIPCATRGGDDYKENEIYLYYYTDEHMLNIQSKEEHNFIVYRGDEELDVIHEESPDPETNMQSYIVEDVYDDENIEILIDEDEE